MLLENEISSKKSKRQTINIEPKILPDSPEKKYSAKLETAFKQAYHLIQQSRALHNQLDKRAKKAFVKECNPLIKLFNRCRRQLASASSGQLFSIEQNLQEIAAQSQSLYDRYKLQRKWRADSSPQTQKNINTAGRDTENGAVKRQSRFYKALGTISVATFILAACTPEGQTKEPTPIVIEDETEQSTGTETVEDILNTPDVPLLTVEATTTPQEPLAIELISTEDLDQETIDALEEQTSEFVEAATDSINKDPALKAALYSENGLKVAFDPSRLIYHDGMWGYFAPEGGSLSNNLLIISNAQGSEGEIRFCSIDGASRVLSLNFSEEAQFLDFGMIEGNSVCMVRNKDNNEIQAITNPTGKWTTPQESGYGEIDAETSALTDGVSALELAKNGGEEATATPEATPEAMTQAEIRAEILAAGVNLDDLANSRDEWTNSHVAIETFQNNIDNLNFGRENAGAITTVVIGLESVENLNELEQALLTDGGWKLTTFAKLAYKDINGDWQIIKVPLNAYHAEDDLVWMKDVSNRSAPYFMEGETFIQPDDNGVFIIPFVNTWTSVSKNAGYHYGVGSFIIFSTAWLEDPTYVHSDCLLGDPPRYSEEQLIEFRKTGDPSIFGYQDSDGYYILWPLVTFNADVSELTNYDHE